MTRGLGSLGVVIALLMVATAAGASVFGATLTANGTTYASATVQLEGTTGATNCYSTGSGAGGSVNANSSVCSSGSPVPTGSLSTTSSSSATTILKSPGTATASTATIASASCGVAQLSDAGTTARWGGSGSNTALVLNGLTYQAAGPLGTKAITTDGSTGWAETTLQYTDPESFTILMWFKTSAATGSLVGFEDNQTAPSSAANYDRMLWIDPTGHLVWALYNGANQAITSGSSYTNGAWHFVAASVGAAGQKLYVDGALAASSANTTAQTGYSGWWSVGLSGALNGGWTDTPTTAYFNGSLAQLSVIPSQLTAAQVSALNADNTLSTYAAGVNALTPVNYWALNDSGSVPFEGLVPGGTPSTTLVDASGNANTGTAQGAATLGVAGPTTLGGNAVSLGGVSGYVQTAKSYANPEGFSTVAWFKTTSASGGTVMGFTNLQGNGTPASWDRLLWIDNAGKLVWGVYPGSAKEVTSTSAYNDGNWHLVVAEIGSSGQQLWVDGTQVAVNALVTTAQSYTGYWHLGWAYETTWPDAPTSSYLTGSLSQVGVVSTQLSASQISTLYNAGSTAAFATDLGQLSPTSYWPLQDSASNVCGTSEMTVQQTVGATNTCIYPSAAGTCAAPSATYLVTGLGVRSITAPTASTPVTIKATMELSAVSPAGVAGLHELADIGFGTTKSSTLWSAQIAYPNAWSQL